MNELLGICALPQTPDAYDIAVIATAVLAVDVVPAMISSSGLTILPFLGDAKIDEEPR